MLKALQTNFPNKKVYLSLEERMGCGIGACFACVCQTGDEFQVILIKRFVVTVQYSKLGRWYYEHA